jgi:hypothetical protein
MSLTLSSTTESLENMNAALRPGEEWKPPPEKPKEPASTGETPVDQLPPQEFNEQRDRAIRENKDWARDRLNGGENENRKKMYRGNGGVDKRIDRLTKNWRTEESRRVAAETELAELKASLNGGAPVQAPHLNGTVLGTTRSCPQCARVGFVASRPSRRSTR